ncbi:hypothetical protein UG55_10036 [Frankia sp. EI5c]|uniref:hypothetical protein n=1 Tax=Frankia sp. EI5c TaxID=683316 RepID=UPI0007C2D059|nr:hypothetical protein [Frankia sp. EI5c]OAA29195.1 hypothetical protein UG55_10036 [Frankia sp. EI5c]
MSGHATRRNSTPPTGQPDVTAVPAGWWVRPAGSGAADPMDPAFAALPDPDGATTVIVGAAGGPPPPASAVAAFLLAMAPARQDDVIVALYGRGLAGERALPGQLAELTGRAVLAQHGLLLTGPDGAAQVVAIDGPAASAWCPFVQHCLHVPGTSPTVIRWHDPAPGLRGLGAGDYRLAGDWVVRLVPAGLVLRQEGAPPNTALDAAAFDPARLDLIVDHPRGELPDGVLAALGRLADALPRPARRRLRVVLPPGTAEAEALRMRWAVPAPQHIRRAAGGGGSAVGGGGGSAVGRGPGGTGPRPVVPATALAVTAAGRMRLVDPAASRPSG